MTHQKTFVVDGESDKPTTLIGAMNMTGEDALSAKTGKIGPPSANDICEETRDFDVVTHDKNIASDLGRLFAFDYSSATHTPPYKAGDNCPEPSPPLSSSSLI